MNHPAKSSAPKGSKGRGERIWRWLLRRHDDNRESLVRSLVAKIPATWSEGDCIPWQGQRNPVSGYPTLNVRLVPGGKNTNIYAHHIFWTLANLRPIPDEFELGHSCDNRICVNPAHLSLMVRGPNLHQRNARHKWKNNQCPF